MAKQQIVHCLNIARQFNMVVFQMPLEAIRFCFCLPHKFVDCIWQMAFALISFVFVFSIFRALSLCLCLSFSSSPTLSFLFVFFSDCCCKCYLVIVDFRMQLNEHIPIQLRKIMLDVLVQRNPLSNLLVVSIIRF